MTPIEPPDRRHAEGHDNEGAGAMTMRARQKAETRRRLLEAALEEFLESSPTAASLDAVAERAGVSRPSLFFHFGSRLELMDQLAQHLIETRFVSRAEAARHVDIRGFVDAYLAEQRRPETRLLWQLGDQLQLDRPTGPNLAYWRTVAEIEAHLDEAGHERRRAHDLALVLASALMLVARRAAFGLTSGAEERDFVAALCELAGRGTSRC